MCGTYKCKEKYPLIGMVALCKKKLTSTLAGLMLRVNCLFSFPLLSPLFPTSRPHKWALTTTDDVNMPESSSVGHMSKRPCLTLQARHICTNSKAVSMHVLSHSPALKYGSWEG